MSVTSPGMVTAVSIISCLSYMIPWVLYSGKMTRSRPGSPSFMPSTICRILWAFSITSAVVCSRGIL